MKKIAVLIVILVISNQTLFAHNPLSAMYYLEVKQDMSILNINLSQTGLNEALKGHYSTMELEELSDKDYKQLTINYLKENFQLDINGHRITLLEGGIKLGSHQTDVKFLTSGLPKTFKSLNVKIKAFIENENHQTVFSLLLNGNTSKVILNQANGFAALVQFENGLMVETTNTLNKNYLWFLMLIPIILYRKNLIAKLS